MCLGTANSSVFPKNRSPSSHESTPQHYFRLIYFDSRTHFDGIFPWNILSRRQSSLPPTLDYTARRQMTRKSFILFCDEWNKTKRFFINHLVSPKKKELFRERKSLFDNRRWQKEEEEITDENQFFISFFSFSNDYVRDLQKNLFAMSGWLLWNFSLEIESFKIVIEWNGEEKEMKIQGLIWFGNNEGLFLARSRI